jgi:hypothetical protein
MTRGQATGSRQVQTSAKLSPMFSAAENPPAMCTSLGRGAPDHARAPEAVTLFEVLAKSTSHLVDRCCARQDIAESVSSLPRFPPLQPSADAVLIGFNQSSGMLRLRESGNSLTERGYRAARQNAGYSPEQ